MGKRNEVGGPICEHCGSTKMGFVSSREITKNTERVTYKCYDCKRETYIDTDTSQ
jgi:hypothetical protein